MIEKTGPVARERLKDNKGIHLTALKLSKLNGGRLTAYTWDDKETGTLLMHSHAGSSVP